MVGKAGKVVVDLLLTVGIKVSSDLHGADSIEEEFRIIKKSYFKRALALHPDKGGSAEEFRDLLSSFTALRELFEKQSLASFAQSQRQSIADLSGTRDDGPIPSWEFYATAAEEQMPPYRCELAKTNRSKCTAKGSAKKCDDLKIGKGEIRVGWVDQLNVRGGADAVGSASGQYEKWKHLKCWRVPKKVWTGLPYPDDCRDCDLYKNAIASMNSVMLCGFDELSDDAKEKFVNHVMNKENWAGKVTRSVPVPPPAPPTISSASSAAGAASAAGGVASAAVSLATSIAATASSILLRRREKYSIPLPGQNGAIPNVLAGKICVLTGIYPELGGGAGLDLGKTKMRALVESFGGVVRSTVSGKTELLIRGQQPGVRKVDKARERGIQQIELGGLDDVIFGKKLLEEVEEPKITEFSAGWGAKGSGLALTASTQALAYASGQTLEEAEKTRPRGVVQSEIEVASPQQLPGFEARKKADAEKMKKVKAYYGNMTGSDMTDYLENNNQLSSGLKAEKLARICDCELYGCLPLCPQCAKGKLKVTYPCKLGHGGQGKYRCPGYYDADALCPRSCSFSAIAVERKPFVGARVNWEDSSSSSSSSSDEEAESPMGTPAKSSHAKEGSKMKAPVKKQASKRKVASYDVTCDRCGEQCTELSWFVKRISEDYCHKCYNELQLDDGEQQSHGHRVGVKKLKM